MRYDSIRLWLYVSVPSMCLLTVNGGVEAPRIADSSSTNPASISSARTMKRFPPRCASTIQTVRPSESTAETQPKLQPALWRLSAMISQDFI